MSSLRLTSLPAPTLFVLCFAAACGQDTGVVDPAAREVAPAFASGGEGPLTVLDATNAEGLVGAADVGTERAATGGWATGHTDVTIGTAHEKISFSALSTGAFPNAKGQAELHIVSSLGRTDVHADVDCLAIAANNAWVSGPVTKFRRNGEDIPILPGFQLLFRVQDNGEGGTTVDMVSDVAARFTAQVCGRMGPLALFPSDDGNVQVSQR